MESTTPGYSEALTDGVRVSVQSRYLPERSNPGRRQFLFSYRVTIANEGDVPVRLMTRHWVITNADGEVEEVDGVGVIGETPVIKPGQSHVYSSFCPLHSEFGNMHGSYGMVRGSGDAFQAEVAPFLLALPMAVQ